MKLIHKKDLLKINHEVIFHHYTGAYPEDFNIYIETCGERDFIYQSLIGAFDSSGSDHDMKMINCAEENSDFDIPVNYDCASRDGYFEDNDKYYVLSKVDLKKLIDRLTITYNQMPDETEKEYANGSN